MKNFKLLGLAFLAFVVFAQFTFAATSCTSNTLSGNPVSGPPGPGSEIGPPASSGADPCTNSIGLTFQNWQGFFGSGFSGTPFLFTANFGGGGLVTMSDNIAPPQDWDLEFQVVGTISGIILSNSSGAGTSVTETVCSVKINFGSSCAGSGGVVLGSGSVSGSTTTFISVAANTGGWIFKDVSGTSSFSQTFTPEPLSLSLTGIGLLGLGMLGRRLKK